MKFEITISILAHVFIVVSSDRLNVDEALADVRSSADKLKMKLRNQIAQTANVFDNPLKLDKDLALSYLNGSLRPPDLEFRRIGIIPELLRVAPRDVLQIKLGDGMNLTLGIMITARSTRQQPTLKWRTNPNDLYTVVEIDLGPQNAPVMFLHWLVTNVPSSRSIDSGDTVAEYIPSGPRAQTPNRRYVFLVYRQRSIITDPEIGRQNMNWSGFVRKHRFEERPIAGTFMLVSCDESVRLTWNELGLTDDPGC